MCGDPFDEIQCEDFYGDEPEPIDFEPDPDADRDRRIEKDFDELTIRDFIPEEAGWLNSDGTTGPVGEAFLASLNPEDFV